jgi:serine protease Do
VTVSNITPEIAEQLQLGDDAQGVIVLKTATRRRLFGMQVQPGDIVIGINGVEVHSVAELQAALAKSTRGFQINLVRNGMQITMSVM